MFTFEKEISGREGSILGSDKTIITCNVILEGQSELQQFQLEIVLINAPILSYANIS